ncbi:tRNA (adenosine(37)-N6)-threonylcarbamoyltransferase complex transferase subunit TsaD [Silvibacterium dinghuense]|uniref:tRNA (adenosine(37)-N6)-threonylcarbamoyltransferase complex transferase subunit TsaD n=1 Tax=Silvibacterium dinghuense TaxID=1560006 RepID=UPI001E283F32|nr:tRNA (adenosine(37)-N6)-threonylcarbamoyltransferase complex transferase subunit TsaD [Silvibacterium dinghuense]
MPLGLILGIESSCDETAAAIVERGTVMRANVVASQIATHSPYGGVVPELASREHLRNIVPVVRAAMEQASLKLSDIDAIAVTSGPGLAGALMVGISYAKALAFALGKPLIAVNHLEGHIHAVLLAQSAVLQNQPQAQLAETEDRTLPEGPVLALVVSGGHTHLYLARRRGESWTYRNVGRTLDDAAGEAYDKVAKLLGLGYPGGPWIDALAAHGNPHAVPFAISNIKAKAHRGGRKGITSYMANKAAVPTGSTAKQAVIPTGAEPEGRSEAEGPAVPLAVDHDPEFTETLFSFSGIKTAVLRYTQVHEMQASIEHRRAVLATMPDAKPSTALAEVLAVCDQPTLDLIASFQRAVVDDLRRKTFRTAEALGATTLLVSGGVAANRELRVRFTAEAADRDLFIAFPSLALSTDNAAMIAAAAWPKFLARDFAAETLSADPGLALGR